MDNIAEYDIDGPNFSRNEEANHEKDFKEKYMKSVLSKLVILSMFIIFFIVTILSKSAMLYNISIAFITFAVIYNIFLFFKYGNIYI